jgi:nucleotide-binding universal stress UspA family protein
MTGSVVVGVDGSACSLDAVDLAYREAAARNRPLHVVHAFAWPYLHVPLGPSPSGPPEGGLRRQAEAVLAQALERARAAGSAVPVSGEVVTGFPAAVLAARSREAALVVVGDRGVGGFAGLLIGSVAVQLAAHAAAPLLVARGRPVPEGPVLLAVDGSPANEPAVEFAFEEAALRGVALEALHAWMYPVPSERGELLPLVYEAADVEAEEGRLLAEALAGRGDKYPDLVVRRRLVRTRTRRALIEASGEAQLVVVGTRGAGGFAGLLLGSVSQAVLHHARCPVAVVPVAHREPDSGST